ncbi:MAG: hypothetical protein MRY83_07325 [Flavobacteriales bacterium]|nr:hypothetical protein [Flavobacteriales bacterium]
MRLLKRILIVVGIIVASLLILLWILDKPLPEVSNDDPEPLMNKMANAIQLEKWKATKYVSWNFAGRHHYVWDKDRNYAKISWDEYEVIMRLEDQSGMAYKNEKELVGTHKSKTIDKAWSYWCNDSFWLNAPAKAFDKGTKRQIVKTDNGDALLITYPSGGVTPGDAYLWFLDEKGLPIEYKMWVSIIPVGGVSATWNDWEESSTGAMLSKKRSLLGMDLSMEPLKTGMSLEDLGIDHDPFEVLP